MTKIRLWVDDQIPLLPDFNAHARTYGEAIDYLKSGKVIAISLDHDLGEEKTGYDIAVWIEEMAMCGDLSRIRWTVHGADSVGRIRIVQTLKSADIFWNQNGGC